MRRLKQLGPILLWPGVARAEATGLPAAPDDALLLAAGALLLVGLVFLALLLWLRTKLKRAGATIRRLETDKRRLDESLSAAPDGYYRWDLDENGAVLEESCSRRLAVLLGLYGGRAAGFEDVKGNLDRESAQALDQAVTLLHRQGAGFELELGFAEGPRRLLAIGCRAADEDGVPLADLVWMRDVTEGATQVASLSDERLSLAGERDRLRGLLDALPMPVWMRDGDLALLYCNQSYAQAVDRPGPAETIAAGVELVPGIMQREARALAARARASGASRSESFHLVMGGARQYCDITEVPFMTESGLMTAGIASDRTRLEELEHEVQRHVAAHGEVLENLATAIAIFGSDTRLSFFNTAFALLWGLDSDWLRSGPHYGGLLDILREQRRLPEAASWRAYKEEELRRFTDLPEAREDLLHLPDERTLRRVVSAHPFGGLVFTYEDVTDRLALERSHRTSLAVHRETLHNLHEAVAVFSSDGRLRLSNPAYGRIWDFAPAELEGGPHFSEQVEHFHRYFADESDWPGVKAAIQALISERIAHQGRLDRADGSIIDYASVPLPDGAVLTTWLDVSDTARVERALRDRNEALSAADRLKSEFIANVSAEVKTPINTILGFSEMLSGEVYGTLNVRQQDYVRGISQAGSVLQQVLSDILDLATIEAGQMTLSLNAVDIHAMLTAVLRLIRERLREKRLVLNFDCPLDIGWMVADERRIRQVLFNLLSNAAKYTDREGQITLAAMRSEPGAGGEEIIFTIADTGQGLPEADRAELQSGALERPAEERSGADVGLSLVKNFVKLHGGRIEVVTVQGEGTTFFLHIPAGKSESP